MNHRKQASKLGKQVSEILAEYGYDVLRYSIAIVFIWFGALKPLGVSPAAELVAQTVFFLDPSIAVPVLGVWEVIIGVCFLYRPWLKYGIVLLAPQMAGTFLPLVLLPDVTYQTFPYALTTEGQYIIKNLVLIGGAMVLGGRLHDKQ